MSKEKSKPGKSVQTFNIPAVGTHNTVPPFSIAMRPGVEVQLHAVTITGRALGPSLYVGGGIHGDELNGVEACWRLAREIDETKLKGSVTLVPVQNPGGFLYRVRLNPFDPIDPDWVHPADPTSTPGGAYVQNLKKILWDLASKADCVIDLHTAGAGGSNNTVVILPPETGNGAGKRSLELALAFGGDRISQHEKEEDYGWPVRFTMPFVAVREGRAGLYPEGGQGGSSPPEQRFIDYFVTGVLNVMKKMDLLEGDIVKQGERLVGGSLERPQTLRAPADGILKTFVKTGDRVSKGQAIAEVHIMPDGLEELKAPGDGLVTFLQTWGSTAKGNRVATISPSKAG